MKLFNLVMIIILQKVHIVENSSVRRRCMLERRMLSSNRTVVQQQSNTRGRHQNGFQSHSRHHVRPRFKRQFLMPMPSQNEVPPTDEESDSVRTRSLCPWSWVRDVNATRIPRVMFKAECHHDNGNNMCDFSFSNLMDNNRTRGYLEYLSFETECALVYHRIRVRFECCEAGVYRVVSEWIDWPTSCACSRKKVGRAATVN